MKDRKQLDDFRCFRQFLLRSAEIDAPAMPSAVRRTIVAKAATTVGVGAATGTVASHSSALAVQNGAMAFGKPAMILAAKWFGVGAVAAAAGVGSLRVAGTSAVSHAHDPMVQQTIRPAAAVAHSTMRPPAGSPVTSPSNDSTLGGVLAPLAIEASPVPANPETASRLRGERTALVASSSLHGREPGREALVSGRETATRGGQTGTLGCDQVTPGEESPVAQWEMPAPGRESVARERDSRALRLDSIAPELALLDQARSALSTGDAHAALVVLSAYRARFPRGSLKPEEMALRIKALDRQGDRVAARQLAERFLVNYPSSPHAQRIRALVASRDWSR